MRNPYCAAINEFRRKLLAAAAATDAGELLGIGAEMAPALGKLARHALDTHNPALFVTAHALAARYLELRGADAGMLARVVETWGAPPSALAWCSACGRAFRPPENPQAWRLYEVEFPGGAKEVIAVCGSACQAEIAEARWPLYTSFGSHEDLRTFARGIGVAEPPLMPARRRARDAERPS